MIKRWKTKLNFILCASALPIFFTTSCQQTPDKKKFSISIEEDQKNQFSNPTIGDSHIVHYLFSINGNFKIGDEIIVVLENQVIPDKEDIFVELTPESLLFNIDENTKEIDVKVQKILDVQEQIFSARFSLRFILRRDGRNIDSKIINNFFFHNATPIPEQYLLIDQNQKNEIILKGIQRKKEAFDSLKFCNVLLVPEHVNIIEESAFFSQQESVFPIDHKWEIWFSKYGQFTNEENSNNLTKIEKDAFNLWVSLSGNLIFPSSVKEIGDFAFQNSGISSLTLSEKLEKLGEGAFRDSTLNSVTNFPSGLIEIKASTFQECTSLKKIPSFPKQCSKIGEKAFLGCNLVEEITISSSITKIGDKAFSECSKLGTIKFADFTEVPNFEGNDIFLHPANIGTVWLHPKVSSDVIQSWRNYILEEEKTDSEWVSKWKFDSK